MLRKVSLAIVVATSLSLPAIAAAAPAHQKRHVIHHWHDYGFRWNGGSFGPCWTSTPIGLMWNCG